jgi:CRISPR-associated protein Cas1
MRQMLNTLYVTTGDAYLSLDGETIVLTLDGEVLKRYPLLNFESIIKFGHMGVSPALLGHCAKHNIPVCFLSRHGRFLARVVGEYRGNVVLRKQQYRMSDDEIRSLGIARNFVAGKIYNARRVLDRAVRDHALRVNVDLIRQKMSFLKDALKNSYEATSLDVLRGIEGRASTDYFGVFDEMILQQKEDFSFAVRSRRPPLDRVNALLSFLYTLLAHDCASALETVGLDPYVGFLHRDRPGRMSLSLDLMEEMRAFIVDRLVLTMINRRQILVSDFDPEVAGSVLLSDEGRKKVLVAWQEAKQDRIKHPFLGESISRGLIPHVQAQLLARFIRGDLDEYPPFFWK